MFTPCSEKCEILNRENKGYKIFNITDFCNNLPTCEKMIVIAKRFCY